MEVAQDCIKNVRYLPKMPDYRQLDSARGYHLYRYLFGRLAISRNERGETNNQKTAQRVGEDELRKKIIPAVLADEETWNEVVSLNSKDARLTTGRIVGMLSKLKASLEEDYKDYEVGYSRVLTTSDVLVALSYLTELSPKERKNLGLPIGDKLTLLKQTLLSLQTKEGLNDYESIFGAYKESVGLAFGTSEGVLNNLDQVNGLIEASVREALSYLPERSRRTDIAAAASTENTIIELSRKAQREVRRLLVRSGNTQVFLVDNSTEHPFIRYFLPPAFVKKLSQTVVSNERLTDRLPVYLKRVTTSAQGPLPFSDTSLGAHKFGSSYPDLLDKGLQELDGAIERSLLANIPSPSDYELASQEVNKLTLDFYIKVDNDYGSTTPGVFATLASSNTQRTHPYRRVDFSFSSTGIGGTLSHMVKVINTTLITDIPCLKQFFTIAHDVVSTQHIIRDNVSSPIWAHSLVKLCQNRAVGEALYNYEDEDPSSYDDFSFGDPIGQGDFCGFDFFVAQAQSAVQARLRAILNAGVDPKQYVRELCCKVERQIALKRAWQMVKYYPFSSMAMISTVHENILMPEFGEKSLFEMRSLLKTDSNIYFDAFLSIAEALLDEGAYRAAYPNLKKLKAIEAYTNLASRGGSDIDQSSYEVFSSQLIIRYLLCQATYYYLYDLEGPIAEHIQREFSSQVTRQQLVQKSWNLLATAQAHVKVRLKKYLVVGEVSQGTFSPHYKLLSRIYLLRARLLTFFPRMVPMSDTLLPTENFSGQQRTAASIHWGKLYLLEKARLYIAAEGDGEIYAYYAALQSCYYLTAAYAESKDLVLMNKPSSGDVRELDHAHCLMWARRLRDHALISYETTGRQCYNAIKEKSGLPEEFDEYGRYSIEKLPAIFEDRGMQKGRKTSEDNDFLTLDVSLLAINKDVLPKLTSDPPKKNIYLFGTNACHIFLARGLYMLCSDVNEEFAEDDSAAAIDWERKLTLAERLFDLAWAIAEDGCSIARDEGDRQRKKITRSFLVSESKAHYTSREIDSVRDLYPRRVSEVADIGKLYSAACKVLKLYLSSASEKERITTSINKLFGMLHGEYRFESKRFLKVLLLRQSRYNGHLEQFLNKAQQVLEEHMPSSEAVATSLEIKSHRDTLMKALFATLQTN